MNKFIIFMCGLAFTLGSFAPLAAIDRSDREEYDLYDRNRDNRDFNRYDYPQQTSDCPYCQIKQEQTRRLSQTRR
ncbi:MAG: hypothetical protein KDK48_02540 [Chlamydiia bacterium]|nr:hypothetical protein [Chlamydiia bacterium]